MALPTNADVIVVRGYWIDETTGLGVRQPNNASATVTFDPVPLSGAAATVTPNLRDATFSSFLKTRARVAPVNNTSGYFATLLVASNDPDLDAYGGRRVTMSGETPFVIEVPYNASTVTVDAEMAAATGLTLSSSVKAIWLVDAALVTTPTPQPANSYLTSTQTLSSIAAGIEIHDEDLTAHAGLTTRIRTADVFNNFTNKANGQLTTADSGQAIRYLSPSATLTVASGALTDNAANSGGAAGYVEVNVGGTVNRIGGEFSWGAGSAGGTAALVVWQTSIVDGWPSIPAARCHFTLTRDGWIFGIWPSTGAGSQVILASGSLETTALADGTKYRVEIVMDGAAAYLLLPDGQVATITDSRVASLAGGYATWENFYSNASTQSKPKWTRIWASAEPVAAFAGTVASRLSAAIANTYRVRSVDLSSGGAVTSPADPTPKSEVSSTLRQSIVAPPSGKIHQRMSAWVVNSGGVIYLWVPTLADPNTGTALRAPAVQCASGAKNDFTSVEYLHTGLTPGLRYEARWYHYAFGSGSQIVQDSGTGRNPTMTVTAVA